jgi:hypothetical protein
MSSQSSASSVSSSTTAVQRQLPTIAEIVAWIADPINNTIQLPALYAAVSRAGFDWMLLPSFGKSIICKPALLQIAAESDESMTIEEVVAFINMRLGIAFLEICKENKITPLIPTINANVAKSLLELINGTTRQLNGEQNSAIVRVGSVLYDQARRRLVEQYNEKEAALRRMSQVARQMEQQAARDAVYRKHPGQPPVHPIYGRPRLSWLVCWHPECRQRFPNKAELRQHLGLSMQYFADKHHYVHERWAEENADTVSQLEQRGGTFGCPVPGCGSAAYSPTQFVQHLRELGIKPYWSSQDPYRYVAGLENAPSYDQLIASLPQESFLDLADEGTGASSSSSSSSSSSTDPEQQVSSGEGGEKQEKSFIDDVNTDGATVVFDKPVSCARAADWIDPSDSGTTVVFDPITEPLNLPIKSVEDENQDDAGNSDCVVCWTNRPSMLYMKCMHQCVCDTCDSKLGNRCPLCREAIEARIPCLF